MDTNNLDSIDLMERLVGGCPTMMGEMIRSWRKYRGLTVAQLADRACVDEQTIDRIETGEIEILPDTELRSLANALEINPDILARFCPAQEALPSMKRIHYNVSLTTLDLSFTPVSDPSALSGLTALASLNLSGVHVSDLSALSGLIFLASLDLGAHGNSLSGLPASVRKKRERTQA